jgi:hypothetical protein
LSPRGHSRERQHCQWCAALAIQEVHHIAIQGIFSTPGVVETRGTIEEAEEEDVGEEVLEQVVEEQASAANAEDAADDASETDELDELDESEDGKQDLAVDQAWSMTLLCARHSVLV